MHKDLQDFIIQSRERGMTDEQIRQDLLKVGWDEKEINQAINPNFKQSSNNIWKIIILILIIIGIIGGGIWWWQKSADKSADETEQQDLQNQIVTQLPGAQEQQKQADTKLPTLEELQDEISTQIPKVQKSISCNLENRQENIIVHGKVIFPKGIKDQESYEVIGDDSEVSINFDGSFCVYAFQGMPMIIPAIPSNNENGFILSAVVNSDSDVNDFVIDYKSTAIALIYLNPFLNNPKLLDTIPNDPNVIKFADKINSVSNLILSDIKEEGRLFEDYTNAMNSVLESMFSL